MQTVVSSQDVRGIAAPNAAFLDLPLVPAATPACRRTWRGCSRFQAWHLVSVLSLMVSSAAYAVYALLHMGA